MSSMTLPKRVSDFLNQRQDRMYCDTCIQERLGLKWRQQVQLITATLSVTSAFRREVNKCCTCGEVKQVTSSISHLLPFPVAATAERLHISPHWRPKGAKV